MTKVHLRLLKNFIHYFLLLNKNGLTSPYHSDTPCFSLLELVAIAHGYLAALVLFTVFTRSPGSLGTYLVPRGRFCYCPILQMKKLRSPGR